MRILLTSQIQPSGSDSTGYWIDLKFHAPTYFEPNFTKIQDLTWFDHPCLQTNDFLITDFFMKNQNNFDYFIPYYKVNTWLESSPRAYKRQIFQKLYFGNVQFRKSNFIFTIPFMCLCYNCGKKLIITYENNQKFFVYLFHYLKLFLNDIFFWECILD